MRHPTRQAAVAKVRALPRLGRLDTAFPAADGGPVDAIGKDYRALELKNVVQVMPNPQGGYFMKLLKKDIGIVALEVIKAGDASETLLSLPGAIVTGYVGPEANREKGRKKQTVANKNAAKDIVMALRTGSKLK